jgi:cellobiose phosphorylase
MLFSQVGSPLAFFPHKGRMFSIVSEFKKSLERRSARSFAGGSSNLEAPLRSVLFTVEQLAHHARLLAEQHEVGNSREPNRLLSRLGENEKILQEFNRSTLAADRKRRVTPAAEWLLDNFYLIEEQIQMARRHLPRHYSRELPRLTSRPSTGLPRVYDLVLELISHVDAQIDTDHLTAFVAAYQAVTPLNLGELWAIPIMLRLGLIENLRRITTLLAVSRDERDLADYWSDQLHQASELNGSHLIVALAEMTKAELPLSTAFVAEFSQRQLRLDPTVQFARNWIEQRLAEHDLSIERCIQIESQLQAADQVSVSHTIMSLRFLSTTDWRSFVEQMSVVEQTLRTDPSQAYEKMDFPTRDTYRHGVEEIARYGRVAERDVAAKAIELAAKALHEKGPEHRSAHVGYFLVGKGRPQLEQNIRLSWPWRMMLERAVQKSPMTFYGGGILLFLLPVSAALAKSFWDFGIRGGALLFLALVTLLCVSQLAVVVINWLATLLMPPRHLPRLDFAGGIDPEYRTMVVVPTMLTDAEGIGRLLDTLEIHYLANRDEQVYFALLTDFRDAPGEKMPDDEALLAQVAAGVEALNRKYQKDRRNIFFLFHRSRLWNPQENIWMGYERKRGKLAEFNAVLRGRGAERFSKIVGDLSVLPKVRFVITLDTDTQLPRDAARRLAGAIAHPLNRPEFHPEKGIVVEGYSILQPRVGVSLPSASRSWFVRVFAGDAGIDPYTRSVSDVYQDVFAEGSFIGKGIYDVDAFERAVRGRFPENAILSHDLLESLHARSALVSDVELFEEHPSRYSADINRRHRWTRGDWQIAQWLLPRVPGPDARTIDNPLSGLSQWKIFDNLRRSLVPTALMLLLVGGWALLPQTCLPTFVVLTIILAPGLLSLVIELMRKPNEWPWVMHVQSAGQAALRQIGQIVLTLAFLPYDAFISLDAIGRTLVRLLVTRKQLLEWQTSSDAEKTSRADLANFCRTMWIAPAVALAAAVYLTTKHPEQIFTAAPFLALWLAAPAVAWWISQPIVREAPRLSASQMAFLRRTARKTWRFFETFVTDQENWLPPDNFQEHPAPIIASRTSPTNMGLALLANLTAADFGYLSVRGLMDRTSNTLGTMERMDRYRGHFYNWYDTRTLKPLLPQYISTVDSGNLAGHLLTLGAGLAGQAEKPILDSQVFDGLRDILGIIGEFIRGGGRLEQVARLLDKTPADLRGAHGLLIQLDREASGLIATLGDAPPEAKWWMNAFSRTCRDHLDDLNFLAPWLTVNSDPAAATNGLHALFHHVPTLEEVAQLDRSFTAQHSNAHKDIIDAAGEASRRAQQRLRELETLAKRAVALAEMDVSFLFDPARELFTIGYNVTDRRRDASFYDLLSSEARLGSYVAVAQGQVPEKHWFALARLLTSSRGGPILISWGGSMFEYLMPMLVMPTYENTLIDQTCEAAVKAQIDYGQTHGTPWGISESGYNLTDAQGNYQYKSFGVPGLGFKRGLADGLVIAPYASVMALMVAPREACENLQRLADENRMGAYGFYEAVDYTPSRLPPNETSVTVRSFMAHHQGMSFLSLSYLMLDRPMQRRFLDYPPFKSEELLLQERVPKAVTTLSSEDVELAETLDLGGGTEGLMRIFTTPNTPAPEVHLLSNGKYHVVVTNAGGGYSRWRDLAVTRWREDATRDCWGNFCYVREIDSAEFWSVGYQPALQAGKKYEAIFTQGRAEFRQRHGAIELHATISVSPEDDVEIRRLELTNYSNVARTVELTSYAEVVMAPPSADAAHPAFSNLFVQTEMLESHPALLCTRRARSEGEKPPWLFHMMEAQGAEHGELSCETDRAKFIGRGRNLSSPAAMQRFGPLSNSAGSVLDPVVSLRRTVTIPAQETVRVEIIMGMAEQRETAVALVEKYHNARMADRLFDLAWTHSQVNLRQLDATEADAQFYARMAGALVYVHPSRRPPASVLVNNRRGQSGLWSYGISGDLPIVLLRISDGKNMDMVRRMVQAHSYWRLKGLAVELVIVNDDVSVYRQSLQDTITGIVNSSSASQMFNKPGGIFAPRLEQIPAEDRILLLTAARIVLSDEKGTLEEQFQKRAPQESVPLRLEITRSPSPDAPVASPKRDLVFFNGLGGFAPDGKEYVITLQPSPSAPPPAKHGGARRFPSWLTEKADSPANRFSGDLPELTVNRLEIEPDAGQQASSEPLTASVTPAPWVNVLANARFGTVVSESGGAYTWLENSHEFRLTPWNNDPVSDVSGEAFYIRDDETGEFWSPCPLPARGRSPYVVRHGFGYSVFEHTERGIVSEVWVYVAKGMPVKFSSVKLKNISGRPRKLSIIGYWEWVLGDLRSKSLLHVQTEIDAASGAILARNRYNTEFAERVAFVDASIPARSVTGDRKEFLGRNGTLASPAALRASRLSGKIGAGLDSCAALQVTIDLADGKEMEVTFRLGAGRDMVETQQLIQLLRRPNASRDALNEVREYWARTLTAVQVETPDAATNLLANGWLMYQTLSARLWGRTGFYQSGGAFGFRDQLQDAMALVHNEPELLHGQILLAAAHQFREGDVQHWWHPPSDRGVRTHFSDDFLWLPYAVCRYVKCLNDTSILDKYVPFIEGRMLKPEEESYYDLPARSGESATVYDHCVRAIEHGLRFGQHGLPLIGCGDWNDGFNLIGEHGRGESVWLAFFLFDILTQFAALARDRRDAAFAARCLQQAETLRQNIEANAWDGEWYRRAYFDNGDPVGSRENVECQIDSLPQSWSVLSGAGDPDRARMAMDAVEHRLVRRDAGLIQLFDPPFDKSAQNPGYIKGYVPGVRENGGQYTHGAIWTVMAMAHLGDADQAWDLFSLLNPVNHNKTRKQTAVYKTEPYVVAADVYAAPPHVGRGGWTWYTGSAGWMYRLIVESLLGLKLERNKLVLRPLLPAHWENVTLRYRFRETTYDIVVKKTDDHATRIILDGQPLTGEALELENDRRPHRVEVNYTTATASISS